MSNQDMDGSVERRESAARLASSAIFIIAAASIVSALLRAPHGPGGAAAQLSRESGAIGGVLALLSASILVFSKTRFPYYLGLVAGMLATPWFGWNELSLHPGANSWIVLNIADPDLEVKAFLAFTKLSLLSMALLTTAIFCSVMRLLPGQLSLRNLPWRVRTWPAFAGSFLVMAIWFIHGATPYRVPRVCSRGTGSEFRILHVEKHGLHFQETQVSLSRNGKTWVWRHEHQPFQYRSEARVRLISLAGVSLPTLERARAFADSDAAIRQIYTRPAKTLHSWNADAWYVVLRESRTWAFTSEYRTAPPQAARNLFEEIVNLPVADEKPSAIQDVCLGFCYDPVAALDPTMW